MRNQCTLQHKCTYTVSGMERACVYDVWVYCRLHNIKWQIPMPLKLYYPGENEENDDNSVRIASILAKW